MGLGILSSIPFDASLQRAFEQGYGSTPTYAARYENCGYDATKYTAALQQLNDPKNQVTLIVAIGGGIAEQNAASNVHPAQKPTVSLVGGVLPGAPTPGAGKFRDRINLKSFETNLARKKWLRRNYGIQPNDICLLYNPNAATRGQETPGFASTQPVDIRETTDDDTAEVRFDYAFKQIANNIKAVIVSADPWFKQKSTRLVRVADGWATGSKRVMYPFQEYADDYVGRTHPQVNFYGPKLADPSKPDSAYNLLGQLAATGNKPGDPPQLLDGKPIPLLWRIRDFFAWWQ